MKKILLIPLLAMFLLAGSASAQATDALPLAGIGPDSPFFFLDRFGEFIQEFFTFNPEAKAKLQIEFAGERIAEIKALVEKKGPDARGINKAKTLLLGNVAHAAEIVKNEKSIGKDVSALAKEIDNKFDAQEKLLVQSFQDARKKLKKDRLALKKSIAEQAGDSSITASLEQQLNDLKIQDNKLKDTKSEIKESIRGEKKKIEEELRDEDKKADEQKKIKEDEREKSEDMEIENENEIETENENESVDKHEDNKIEKHEGKDTSERGEGSENSA